MCIDYRVVNGFIQLSNYPLPLIDDLLIGFESAMWFMSLDMASRFWAIRMTESFVRLSPEEEAEVDQGVLEFLGLDPSKREDSGSQVSALTDTVTIFQRNIPAPASMGPVLGRSSYIDDIAYGAPTWDQLCADLDALLFRLRYWNISVIVQSFLGSLNYYHKFIEDFTVVAAILYERSERDLARAKAAFEILKKKIVSTPLLRHPDRSKPFVIIPHANRWAACAVLGQGHDGKVQPVRFTGRVQNDAELRYHVAEKEVIAVLRVLQVFRTLLEGCRLEVYTRHSVFKWTLLSKTADGRCVPWGAILSHWDITVRKIQRDEDGLAAIMGAGITHREHLDEVAESLIPAMGRVRRPPVLSVEMLDDTYQGIVLSFDGAARRRPDAEVVDVLYGNSLAGRYSRLAKLMKPKVVLLDGELPQDLERQSLPKGSVGDVADSQSAPLPQAARIFAVLTRSKTQARTLPSPEVSEDALPDEEEPRRPMTPLELRKISKVADLFALNARDVLYRLARSTRGRPTDFVDEPRLVIPDALRSDMLHYAHEDFKGGHQGITRTYEKLRSEFYWPGMYADVEHYVKECVDCVSGKGRPPNEGPSPGNIEPRRPFEVVSMDFVTHMLASERGNTILLLFQDAFSGFVMCKPMRSSTAQDVAEVYEECVFQRFGRVLVVRHDPNPKQERSVQTVARRIRAYIAEADQSDWDDHAESLMFALNTLFDATRLDTPFYLVHGWNAQGTRSAKLGPKPSSIPECTAFVWRRKMQRQYCYAITCAEDLQKKAKRQRSEVQTKKWKELSERLKSGFEKGDSVWLYIPKVQPGLSRKLAHMWHGPFRIDEIHDDFRVKLKVTDSGYRVNPWVHVSLLKPRALFPKRPTVEIEVAEDDDFDAALLPEDSWEPDSERNEYEVEKILDLRWSKRTRTSRRTREYLVKWKGYDDPGWLPLSQLSCGALLYEFNQGARARTRFQTMQAGDDHPRA
ncbi:unnamed protein product [Phytophthora fragariaefolia]|uniref:Unnamed protein product n=1 Tax=Phytophthora fragariaefolia TaxID=1490495 RepID=A0A9W6UAW9_9STRA|nr:unnamed protein product [Phytophthora fragariaefolia]